MDCTLCLTPSAEPIAGPLQRDFYHCSVCDLVFLNPVERLAPAEEKLRYQEHNNDVNDPRYQDFVRPLVDAICERVPTGARGLDFGAGEGPVSAVMLEARSYEVERYDPFFWPNAEVLNETYDFVYASEVVEHLSNPGREFARLKDLVNPGGLLAIMTLMRTEKTDLPNWYYLRDPTHVCAYSRNTFEWIKQSLEFERLEFPTDRVIVLG